MTAIKGIKFLYDIHSIAEALNLNEVKLIQEQKQAEFATVINMDFWNIYDSDSMDRACTG